MADQYDDLWNQAQAGSKPSTDQLWSQATTPSEPISGRIADQFYQDVKPYSDVVKAFGQGFEQQFNNGTSPEINETLRKLGVFNDYQTGRVSIGRHFNEAVYRPVIAVGLAGLGLFGGLASATGQVGAELQENAEKGEKTFTPLLGATTAHNLFTPEGGAGEVISAVPGGFVPELHIPELRAERVIGEGEEGYFGTKESTPQQKADRSEAQQALPQGPDVPNLHTVARSLAPEQFEEYDRLNQTRDLYRRQLDDLSTAQEPSPVAKEVQDQIDTILSKVGGNEDRLTNKASDRLEDLRQTLEDTSKKSDTPEMAELRASLQQVDFRMRDLAPDVATAYRYAGERYGAFLEPQRALETAEQGTSGTQVPPTEDATVRPSVSLIEDDIKSKLKALGRPDEEAEASAAVVKAYYETKAQRFEGSLGTAEQIYRTEAPDIIRGVEDGSRRNELNQYVGPKGSLNVRSNMATARNFNIAKTMENEGKTPSQIRLATGWFKGSLDGKWRNEISDQDAKLHTAFGKLKESDVFGETHELSLDQVLHHPKLFEAYPEAREIKFSKTAPILDIWQSIQGFFDRDQNKLSVTPYAEKPLSVMLHEVQHWIQAKEGFARGGNTSTVIGNLPPEKLQKLFVDTINSTKKTISEVAQNIEIIKKASTSIDFDKGRELEDQTKQAYEEYKKVRELDQSNPERKKAVSDLMAKDQDFVNFKKDLVKKIFGKESPLDLDDANFSLFSRIMSAILDPKKDFSDLVDRLNKDFVGLQENLAKLQQGDKDALQKNVSKDTSFKLYQAIAGEIEARDTQERQNLSPEERLNTEPYSSQKFDPEDVSTVFDQEKRGSITITPEGAKNVIRLFKDADASTFMHEIAHQFLEDLRKDSQRPEAPADLILDSKIVHDWLKASEDKPLTKAQHERFARGFEKYLMEGRAPSTELVGVFQKFKNWLTQIYQTVSKLRVNISPDIRDVFSRMLSEDPDYKGVTVAPETEAESGGQSFPTPESEPSPVTPLTEPSKPTKQEPANFPNGQVAYNQTKYISKEGKVNFEGIQSNEDLENFITAFSEQHGNFEADRGRGLTRSDIIQSAEIFGKNAREMDRNFTKLRKLTVDSKIPFSVRVAALEQYALQNSQAAMDAAMSENAVETANAALRFKEILRTVAGVETSWGQTGQALQAIKVTKFQSEQLSELLQSKVGLTPEQMKVRMEAIKALDTPQKINAFLNKMIEPSYGEMILEAFKNFLISGPLTHIQYLVGNEIYTAMKAGPETFGATLIGDLREKITGKESEVGGRVHHGEALEGLYSFAFAQKDGLKAMKDAFLQGQTLALPSEELASTPFTPSPKIPGLLGSVVRIPSERMVTPIHSANSTINYLTFRNQLIFRSVVDEGLKPGTTEFSGRMAALKNDTPLEIMKEATKLAREGSLMGPAGSWTRKIQNIVTTEVNLPVLGRTQLFGFISPFVHVSGNIGRMSVIDRSPLGLWSQRIQDDVSGKNGTFAQDTSISKIVVGTAVWGTLAGLVATGMVNPAAPKNFKEAAVDKYVNGLPHSIKVGEMSYALDRLGIWGSNIALGIDVWTAAKNGWDQDSLQVAAGEFGKAVWGHMSDEGFLGDISDLVKANEDPDHYGASWKKNFLSEIGVPFSIGSTQVAHQIDPYERVQKTQSDYFLNRIPFASETLQPKIDIFGQPVPHKEFWGIYAQQIHDDPVTTFLADKGFFPGPASQKIRGIQLTPTQYTEFAVARGQLLRSLLEQDLQIPGFDKLPLKTQHDLIEGSTKLATKNASDAIMTKYLGSGETDIATKANNLKSNLVNGN